MRRRTNLGAGRRVVIDVGALTYPDAASIRGKRVTVTLDAVVFERAFASIAGDANDTEEITLKADSATIKKEVLPPPPEGP